MKCNWLWAAVVASLLAGCGEQHQVPGTATALQSNIDRSRYELAEEPEGGIGVLSARETVKDGEHVVMVGRIGGSATPWVEGRAAFVLADAATLCQAEQDECDPACTKPCCADKELVGSTALVKVVDAQGDTLAADARDLFGIKEADMIVVRGRAKRDEAGNLTILADGVYIRK